MSYKVIKDFTDANENSEGHVYRVGDDYPFQQYVGAQTKDRLSELMQSDGPNESFDGPVIEEVKD